MPRKPKAKDGLTARERVAIYEAEQAQKQARMGAERESLESVPDALSLKAEPIPPKSAKKVERILPKTQHATVRVDFSLPLDRVKPMHGMCNGPVSYGADISALYRDIGVPSVRFAGTDTAISAFAVDISRIFKNWSADPHDASNYDFVATDEYVRAAHDCGAKVIFRLGESLDRSGSKTCELPIDADVWCEVATNVIKHYNDYFAGGYAYGIERFEVLEYHKGANKGDRDRLFALYRRLAGVIKLYDGDLKVGGMCFDDEADARDFIKFCRKNHAPLDFLSLSCFDSSPLDVSEKVRNIVPTLKNLGYSDCEIIIGEWSYIAKNVDASTNIAKNIMFGRNGDSSVRAKLFSEQSSIKGAAYALSSMLELGAIGEVASAHMYDGQPALSPWCAICDRFGEPLKTYYAFKMFGELYRAGASVYCESEQSEGYAHSGIYAAAATSADGSACVLVSSFEGCGVVDLRLEGIPSDLYTAEVFILDGVKNFERGDSVQLNGQKKRLLLNLSEYGAVLVKLY